MKLICGVDFGYFLVLLVFLIGLSAADLEQGKNRRGAVGTAGLFAFPRVGRSESIFEPPMRSDGDMVNFEELMPASFDEYEEYSKLGDGKRANLIAFPRVGRPDVESRKWTRLLTLDKSSGGLWFPPRFTKVQKRSASPNKYQAAEKF